LKAESETLAFAFVRKNKLAVIKTLMRRLNTDVTAVEERYQDLLRRVERKAFRSLDGLLSTPRLYRSRLRGSKDQVKCKLS
jgi:hypothetical protein